MLREKIQAGVRAHPVNPSTLEAELEAQELQGCLPYLMSSRKAKST